VQEIAVSSGELPFGGAGTACADQEAPFQPSAAALKSVPSPAASQEVDEVQDTPLSDLRLAEVCWADQDVPFQMSTWPSAPAAMQKVAETQDTEVRLPPGTVCSAQVVPFQSSAPPPAVDELTPTASQKIAEAHDTPARLIRTPLVALTGSGAGWICHVLPFHVSARATVAALVPPKREPTASQKAADVQDTALRLLVSAPRGDTASWIVHLVPFQDSARASCPLLLDTWELPAVSHAVTVAHDTWLRLVTDAFAGFGVVCTAQEVPFQVTPRLKVPPELPVYMPAASQNAAVTQDTPARSIDAELAGVGTV
jgi:hypothetical protein